MVCCSSGEEDSHDDLFDILRHVPGRMGVHVHLQVVPMDLHAVAILRPHDLSISSPDYGCTCVGHHLSIQFWKRSTSLS